MYRIDQGISMGKEYSNREELLKTAQNALHIPFGELDKTNRLHSVKGGIGQTVEENVFDYAINSDSEPDIPNLGIDIKTAGVIKNKSKLNWKKKKFYVVRNSMIQK